MNSEENSNFFNQTGNVVLVSLILVAIILSYFLYKKVNNKGISSLGNTQTQNGTADISSLPPLTADERGALNFPKSDAPIAEIMAHIAFVKRAAIATDTIVIGPSCKASPVVVKTQKGANLVFKNNDSLPHTVSFDRTHSFPVSAQGSVTIPVDFGEVGGFYGYGCESSISAIGMVLITE